MAQAKQSLTRCAWCGSEPDYVAYHDKEWGVPVHDDRMLFEMLILGGAQAGLNWRMILRKRNAYREAFDNFDPFKIAGYSETDAERLMINTGIIRNRQKIRSAIHNARAACKIIDATGSLSRYLWAFTNHFPVRNAWTSVQQIPVRSAQSDAMSLELKRKGFSFVGSTICYAFMQSVGMVNDHLVDCFRYEEIMRMV
ncbi:DNA-3-methyladenine glycosylase I [bacterium]|nr:DNA-3-methyladenine glycosylase I [candidate division CSSED10-310 bacterium]